MVQVSKQRVPPHEVVISTGTEPVATPLETSWKLTFDGVTEIESELTEVAGLGLTGPTRTTWATAFAADSVTTPARTTAPIIPLPIIPLNSASFFGKLHT